MSPARAVAAAWLAAFALVAGVAAYLQHRLDAAVVAVAAGHLVFEAPVVAIGSSSMRHAIPPRGEGGADSLLGDGAAHQRAAWNLVDERHVLDAFEGALAAHTRVVLLELNPFVLDFAHERRAPPAAAVVPHTLIARWGQHFINLMGESRFAVKALALGSPLAAQPDDEVLPQERFRPAALERQLQDNYPLLARDPVELPRLQRLLARARARGVSVVLFAPPRSDSAARHMQPQAVEAIQRHLGHWAAQLQLPLFAPGPVWPDELFVDAAHVNEAGRARLLAELRAFWAGQGA